MKITYGAVLPLPLEEAFAFMADPANWPLFSPGVRGVTKDDDWGRVGSHARVTSIVLGRPLTMELELKERMGSTTQNSGRCQIAQISATSSDRSGAAFPGQPIVFDESAGTRVTNGCRVVSGGGRISPARVTNGAPWLDPVATHPKGRS